MAEVNMDELKALLAEFVSAVNQSLKSHHESLSRYRPSRGTNRTTSRRFGSSRLCWQSAARVGRSVFHWLPAPAG